MCGSGGVKTPGILQEFEMAKFEVIYLITEVTYMKKSRVVDKEGSVHMLEVETTKKTTPGAYGHEDIHVGDVLEINGQMADKARSNTKFFKEVFPDKKKSKK